MDLGAAILILVLLGLMVVVFIAFWLWILVGLAMLTPRASGTAVDEPAAQAENLTYNPCPTCGAIQSRWNAMNVLQRAAALPAFAIHATRCALAGCPLTLL